MWVMLNRMLKAASFKKAFELFEKGRTQYGRNILEDLQTEYVELCDEVKFLKKQLVEVAEIVDLTESIEYDGQKYWLVEDLHKRGPYCQLCYDRDGLLIRLQDKERNWRCLSCGNIFAKPQKMDETLSGEKNIGKVINSVIPLFVK